MDFREGRGRVGSLLINGGGGYSLLFLSRDNRECVELSATTYSTIPLLSGTTFWLTVERSCTHVLTAIHHLSTSLFYTSPGGPVLEINYSGYHGRGPKAFLYFWKPRLTRKRKLGRRKHCFVPAKYIVLSPQIPFMVPPPHFIKSKMFQICKRPKKHFIRTLPVIRPVSLPPTLHYFSLKHFDTMF